MYAVANWKPSQRLLEHEKTKETCVSRWPVAGPSGCILTSSQQSGVNGYKVFPEISLKKEAQIYSK
jgi:hypothetical protein